MKWQKFDNSVSSESNQAAPPPESAPVTPHSTCPKCQYTLGVEEQGLTFCPDCSFPLHLLGGKYRLDKELAEGGFGVVYVASQLQSPEPCVVKIIRPEVFDMAGMKARFQREIRVTTQIAHESEHIINIFDHGKEEEIGHFYTMEFLKGESLDDRLASQKALSFQQVFHIFDQICEALAVAHASGIIHRDLKPDNVFLIERNNDPLFVKVLDFGIAKPLEGTVNVGLTKGALGTPDYMAPEQCTNQEISPATDLYALGIMMYQMLTDTLPFLDNSMAGLMMKHLTEPPESMLSRRPDLNLPPELDQAILKSLAKQPEERFASIQEMRQALAPFYSMGGVVTAAPMQTARASALAPTGQDSAAFAPTGTFTPASNIELSDSFSHVMSGEKVRTRQPPLAAPPKSSNSQTLLMGVLLVLIVALGGAVFLFKDQLLGKTKKATVSSRSAPVKRARKKTNKAMLRTAPGKRNVALAVDSRRAAPPPVQGDGDDDDDDDDSADPVKPRSVKKRIRRRRRVRKRRSKRRAVAQRLGFAEKKCGKSPAGMVYVWNQVSPSRGVRFSFPSCSSCRLKRRSGGYCLTIPKGRKARVQIERKGYQTCIKRLSYKMQHVRWSLAVLNPDDLADDNYGCLRVLK